MTARHSSPLVWCVSNRYREVKGPVQVHAQRMPKTWRLDERVEVAGYRTIVHDGDSEVRMFATFAEAKGQATAWIIGHIETAEERIRDLRAQLDALPEALTDGGAK